MATSGLSKELVFLILQFLNEENYKQTVHRLESESGFFCNVKYIEELVAKGDWDVLENYLAGFISVNDSRYSVKMLFEIRKQRYIEALDSQDRVKALDILNKDLKAFKSVNGELFKEMTHLLTIANIRDNPQLSKYTDNKTARAVLIDELKKLIEQNPDLRDKRQFPCLKNSRLRLLVNQSLNWQHQLCRNPKPNPEIATLLEDHICGPPQAAQAPAPVANQLMGSMLRASYLQQPLQPPETPVFVASSRGQGSMNPPPSLTLVRAAHNVNTTRVDSETFLRRSRHFGTSEEIKNLPTSSVTRPSQGHIFNFLPTDDLPKNVISAINQGSEVKTMDFHPEHQTLLLVGTNTGDISIWEISSRLRIAHRNFSLWNISLCSMALQGSLTNEHPVLVNRVTWSPDGLLLGVAYSKHIVHIYSYHAGHKLQNHLEIEAHVGYVSDIAFTVRYQKLIIITCGEDKTVKVWDAVTGVNQYIFEGHNAPVSSICPHSKDNIQACDSFIFSTATDGKIKTWLYDEPVSKIDYETPGYTWTKMAYSTDGSRFFSSGASQDRDAYLVEWIESEGAVKRTYHGLGKQYAGTVQFDTANRFLAAGDEFSIKFWDMDNKLLLFSTNADGGLPASPCIRFSKDGTLLAVSTSDNGVKILGNPAGLRLIKSVDQNHLESIRLASANAFKASTVAANSVPCSSSAGTNIGFPDRSKLFPAMAAVNQDNQNTPDIKGRNTDVVEFPIVWMAKEITEPSQLRSLRLPDNLLPVKVIRLIYTHSGSGILALACNAVHKLWKWQKSEQNTTAQATADVAPQLWQPASGILMTNDIRDANMENIVPCLALSKNNSYVLSASGGKVSLFNLATFKTMTSFMCPPPAVACLVFHPEDNNIIAVGMSDSSILLYNVRIDLVLEKLSGHENCVTGLAFAIDKKILVSSGVDAQLCVWSTDTWEKLTSKFLKLPSKGASNPLAETRVHFNPNQTHFMVVHETQIAVYDPLNLDSCMQWVPRPAVGSIADAVYSCDGESIFVCTDDGSVSILTANHLKLKCRISYAAYMLSKCGAIKVCPNAIAAHPSDPSQLALGLSDGGVYVLEPLELDKQWGSDPINETSPDLSTNVPNPDQTQVALCVVD
ncbi:hypothetical protein SSX86_013611 [Deinandra increscens subsp. villosa]|uniref:CTLH domain-containing protein n=1 Tax=Deinandra increscens subsp. villosa TaxID=3103831 RepID=A0AAP0D504_9ASTR